MMRMPFSLSLPIACAPVLAVLAAAIPATAATWRVEKDGSGHFTVIQQAVDAAAAGDTIRIGPGLFSERAPYGNPPWQLNACVRVDVADLTIIGAGAKVTIIGDAAPLDVDHEHDVGIAAHAGLGAGRLRVRDLGIQNVYYGASLTSLTGAAIDRCRFAGCLASVASHSLVELAIDASDFASLTGAITGGHHLMAWGPGKVAIDGSSFEISRVHAGGHVHVQAQGVGDTHIARCGFIGGGIGLYATLGNGAAEVRECTFDGQYLKGIINEMSGGVMRVSDTVLRGQYTALSSWSPSTSWEVDRVLVEDARICSFSYIYPQNGHIRGSQLAKGSRFVVEGYNPTLDQPAATFDMRDNWWGTADADSIAAWIEDAHDFPGGDFVIEWQPFRAAPVAAQRRSHGGVKAMFR